MRATQNALTLIWTRQANTMYNTICWQWSWKERELLDLSVSFSNVLELFMPELITYLEVLYLLLNPRLIRFVWWWLSESKTFALSVSAWPDFINFAVQSHCQQTLFMLINQKYPISLHHQLRAAGLLSGVRLSLFVGQEASITGNDYGKQLLSIF